MSRPVSAARTHPKPPPCACCHPVGHFPQPPPARLRCPIDGGVLRDAVASRVCGHVFGLQCAIYHSIEHETCIVCGAALDASDVQPAEAIRSEVNVLRVHCAEGYDRCRWIGTVAEAAAHLNGPHCAVQRVDCPFCDKKGFEVGAAFEAHKAVCDECVVICPQCCEDMPRKDMASHVKVCTADVIEPLRRQRENLSCPATPLGKTDGNGLCPTGPSSNAATAAVEVPSPLPTRPRREEIDRDADDDDDEGMCTTNDTVVATPRPDVLASTVATPRPLSPTRRCSDAAGVADDERPRNVDATLPPTLATTTAATPPRVVAEDEFSPLPPRRQDAVASAPIAAAAGGDGASNDNVRAPCPLRAMGCNAQHTASELTTPATMQLHLCVLAEAFAALQSAHASLTTKHEALAATVEHQKKTIKMLEVRGAFHAGKLNVGTKPSTEGLVESPRTTNAASAAPGAPAAASAFSSAATDGGKSLKTPQRSSAGAKTSRDAASRSASSPAAPDRPRAHDVSANASGSGPVPLFTPSVPSKKKPSASLSSATAARRPPPAAPSCAQPDGHTAASHATKATTS